jgi:hypothetical protein
MVKRKKKEREKKEILVLNYYIKINFNQWCHFIGSKV